MNTAHQILLATALSIGLAGLASAQTTAACADVEVQNVRQQQGHLMVAAYADASSFGKTPMATLRVTAAEAVTRFQLCGLKGEHVALMLYQDLDGDQKMARNAMGMPTEPWGSSGTPSMFGPAWDTGRVALDGKAIVVQLSN